MGNFATTLKAEITRLARKEIRSEIEGLRKASTQQRSEITELKRKVSSLEKQLSRVSGKAARKVAPKSDIESEPARRFSAKGFASHRKRLGLSAEETSTLVHASAQTVLGWEKGRKPQQRHMSAIAAFRKMGKREAKQLLASAED